MENKMRMFLDEWGRLYKAKDRKSEHDAEKNIPPAAWMEVLPDNGTPMTEIQILAELNKRG